LFRASAVPLAIQHADAMTQITSTANEAPIVLKAGGAPVVPVIRYRNLPAAIAWLCAAFGFEKHRITTDSNGGVMFAQLTFGSAMVMLGPVRDSAFDKFLKQPDEIGGAETQVCYFFVADAHTHCARAKAAGAEVVFDIADQVKGGRSYSCRDPEGHLWNFGTYDPWQRQVAPMGEPASPGRSWRGARVAALVIGLLAAAGVGVFATRRAPDAVEVGATSFSDIQTASISLTREAPSAETSQRPDNAAERPEDREASEIKQSVIARALKDQFANDLREQLTQALKERDAAEQAAQATRDQLMKAWIGKVVAEKAAREAQRQLAQERSAKPQSANSSSGQSKVSASP
jgi:uncharacterized glyoxalase superfamily protein PhnB